MGKALPGKSLNDEIRLTISSPDGERQHHYLIIDINDSAPDVR